MVEGTYDPVLVALSYLVAVGASYTALELARRVSQAEGSAVKMWLGAGAFSMGIGIWTMHFVGMLAFSLPMAFTFDVFITIVSLLVGVAASAFAIFVASRKSNSIPNIALSGVVLGGGIASMHYTGMAAMRMDGMISYDPAMVALSVAIAIVAACAAIWIIFTLASYKSEHLGLFKLGAALVMGIAICGMHYTGMAAATYTADNTAMQAMEPGFNTWMAIAMGAAALLILAATHLTIFFDYRLGRAEQENLRLGEILDESANEIYIFDSNNLVFQTVNRGAVDNLGYSKRELHSMTPVDIKPTFTQEEFSKLLQPLRDGSKQELLFETVHRRRDQTEYPVQIHLQLSETMQTPLFVAITTDITERKNLENQLLQAKKLESIGQLAAGIAHEINTPAQFVGDNMRFIKDACRDLMELCASYGNLFKAVEGDAVTPQLIEATAASYKKADTDYLMEEIPVAIEQSLDGITRISNIVRAMKEFSHPGGKDPERVDLNACIRSTVTVASNEWKYVAELETDLAADLPLVGCFPQEINQVVLNLIVNAAHAIAEVKGDEPAEKGRITVSTRCGEGEVEIRVSDTGGGVPDSIKERIFDPFFTTKEVGKGTGQGLAMAYKTVVEQHKGSLDVESAIGLGTTFTICLPLGINEPSTGEVAA